SQNGDEEDGDEDGPEEADNALQAINDEDDEEVMALAIEGDGEDVEDLVEILLDPYSPEIEPSSKAETLTDAEDTDADMEEESDFTDEDDSDDDGPNPINDLLSEGSDDDEDEDEDDEAEEDASED